MLRTHKSGIKKYRNGAIDRIVAPDAGSLRAREKALDSDGMAGVGQFISPGNRPARPAQHLSKLLERCSSSNVLAL